LLGAFSVSDGLENLQSIEEPFAVCYCHRPGIDGDADKAVIAEEYCKRYGIPYMINHNGVVENDSGEFEGQIVTVWAGERKNIPVLARANRSYVNEMSCNLDVLRQMGYIKHLPEAHQKPVNWRDIRKHRWDYNVGQFDIVIADGGFRTERWEKKRYQRYDELAELLVNAGYSVASVGGVAEDYVYGTHDCTEIGLLKTCDMIEQCKLFIGNDSGLYHFAAWIG